MATTTYTVEILSTLLKVLHYRLVRDSGAVPGKLKSSAPC